jgi:hypothetical protein
MNKQETNSVTDAHVAVRSNWMGGLTYVSVSGARTTIIVYNQSHPHSPALSTQLSDSEHPQICPLMLMREGGP